MSKTLKICWHPVRGALRATARVEKEIRRAYLDAGSTDEFTVDMVGKVRMALAEGWAF